MTSKNTDDIPKECLYCIAKRLYINTNADLISKEQVSARFNRLADDGVSSKLKLPNKKTGIKIRFSKDGKERSVLDFSKKQSQEDLVKDKGPNQSSDQTANKSTP